MFSFNATYFLFTREETPMFMTSRGSQNPKTHRHRKVGHTVVESVAAGRDGGILFYFSVSAAAEGEHLKHYGFRINRT